MVTVTHIREYLQQLKLLEAFFLPGLKTRGFQTTKVLYMKAVDTVIERLKK